MFVGNGVFFLDIVLFEIGMRILSFDGTRNTERIPRMSLRYSIDITRPCRLMWIPHDDDGETEPTPRNRTHPSLGSVVR